LRRAPIVLSATVAGVAAVLSFQPHKPSLPAATASTTPSGSSGGTTGSGSASSSSSGSGGGDGSSESSAAKTATGDAISTIYGNAQVRVTVADGDITKIEALQLQSNDPKSVQISTSAEPLLRESALTKQSGDIDAVSGATITSASYEASLQSALDKLEFEAADGSRGSSEVPEVEEFREGPGGPDGFDPGG
jgi:uncharacterized protein with FMN-binding domain